MSYWLHIDGLVNFQTTGMGRDFPLPPSEEWLADYAKHLEKIFEAHTFKGSEGCLGINVINTTGHPCEGEIYPTVVISGSLRDREEVHIKDLINWLQGCITEAEKVFQDRRIECAGVNIDVNSSVHLALCEDEVKAYGYDYYEITNFTQESSHVVSNT